MGQSWESCSVTGHLSVCSAGTQQRWGGAGLGAFIVKHPKNRSATLAEVGQLGKAAPKFFLPFNLPPVFLTSLSSDRVS